MPRSSTTTSRKYKKSSSKQGFLPMRSKSNTIHFQKALPFRMNKNNLFKNIYQKIQSGEGASKKASNAHHDQFKQNSNGIEEVTLDRYNELKADIKIYKKLQQDYNKKLEDMNKQREDEDSRKIQSRMKLIQKQSELVDLEDELAKLKAQVKKLDLKPKYAASSTKDEPRAKPKDIVDYGKVKSAKSEVGAKNNSLKYDEKGVKTLKGVKFTDRQLLGKTLKSRIVGVKVWTEKFNYTICGIQCTYRIDQVIKQGGEHMNRLGLSLYGENNFELSDNDYVKTISGSLGPNNVIEYLVFISHQMKVARFGIVRPNQKQFIYDVQQHQIPVCVYGSLGTKQQQGKPDISYLEQLGFEILLDDRDKASQKSYV